MKAETQSPAAVCVRDLDQFHTAPLALKDVNVGPLYLLATAALRIPCAPSGKLELLVT